MALPLTVQLKDSTPAVLDIMGVEEVETVRELLNQIIAEGVSYPQDQPLSPKIFRRIG